jgi:hypothetical protein
MDVGPPENFLNDTYAIQCLGTFSLLDVSGNVVRRNEASPNKPGTSRWFAVRVGTLMTQGFTTAGDQFDFFAAEKMTYVFAGASLAELPRRSEIICVHGNVFGDGRTPLILLETNGAFRFIANHCMLNAAREPVVEALAGAIIASDNYLAGGPRVPAMQWQLSPQNGLYTVLGNITTREILVKGAALPAPWAPLNVMAL